MLKLPTLLKHTMPRPGSHEFEPSYLVPDTKLSDFWSEVYHRIRHLHLESPVDGGLLKFIDHRYGYFGYRAHTSDPSRWYYHIGIELSFPKSHQIFPVRSGVLEYAGYGAINGYYVLLSHPEITTNDGYVLHTMYCHLKKPLVGFNSYQKMLREVSLGSYPLISIERETSLGNSGSSGVIGIGEFKLYMQFDFRKYGEVPIVIDPLPVLVGETRENKFVLLYS